jgi:hypothetical protein
MSLRRAYDAPVGRLGGPRRSGLPAREQVLVLSVSTCGGNAKGRRYVLAAMRLIVTAEVGSNVA